jgi:hypothetical protein
MAASPATTSRVLFAVLLVLVVNSFPFTVWPAAIPVGGGTQLNPGRSWEDTEPVGTDCTFGGGERGICNTGDCAGDLRCKLSAKHKPKLSVRANGPATRLERIVTTSRQFYLFLSNKLCPIKILVQTYNQSLISINHLYPLDHPMIAEFIYKSPIKLQPRQMCFS